jgi:hypothetical protein
LSRRGETGKPPLISGACGARCAAVYIGTSGQHGVCKREADSLGAAVCSNQPARSPAKNKVCSLSLSFLRDFSAKPDTARSLSSHEYVNSLCTFIGDALANVHKLNPPLPAVPPCLTSNLFVSHLQSSFLLSLFILLALPFLSVFRSWFLYFRTFFLILFSFNILLGAREGRRFKSRIRWIFSILPTALWPWGRLSL